MKWKTDLVKNPKFGDHRDDLDDAFGEFTLFARNKTECYAEFSDANHRALQFAIDLCTPKAKTFLEIGVCRNGSKSSTHTILRNLPDGGVYLGVDIEDKTFLDNSSKGIHTIKTSSSNYSEVVDRLKILGVEQLDFIFIDGWHSINQVLADWEYSNLLSEGGVVGFHDTTSHPGPHTFLKNLNTELWTVQPNLCPKDHGLGYCMRKRSG